MVTLDADTVTSGTEFETALEYFFPNVAQWEDTIV
jgi:hypothetical protein